MRDVELVEAVRRGDGQAWADVWDAYGPRLHAFCTRLLNEPHVAADAVQDTFVVAAQRLDQLRDATKLRAWLYAIARNECTRHGRARARLVPVEKTATMSTPEHLDPGAQAAAADVAELLWAAADGLDDGDKLLLELNVRHGLEGRELAEAAGISPGHVSMATKRMRDRIERSLGALLVARRGRRDCPGLGVVLADWDGTFTVLVRKRVARHVDRCERCGDRRASLVAPLGSLAALPFALPSIELRDRVLGAVSSVPDGAGPDLPATRQPWPGGFPPPPAPDGRRRRAAWVAAAAVALVLAVVGVLAVGGGDGSPDVEVAAGSASSTTSPPSTAAGVGAAPAPGTVDDTPTSVPATSPALGATTTTAAVGGPASDAGPEDLGAPPGEAAGPAVPDAGPPVGLAPTAATVPAAPNRPPTVGATTRSPAGDLQTSCNPANATRTIRVTATDDRGLAAVVLAWTDPAGHPHTTTMTRSGPTWSAPLGPFADVGTVTYRAVATDTDGATRSSPPASVAVLPCPG